MSSRERKKFETHEERIQLYEKSNGICQYCRRLVDINSFTVAHRIANTKSNRKKYGNEIIDHPLNKAVTHPGNCNDGMNIGMNPVKCRALAMRIKATL